MKALVLARVLHGLQPGGRLDAYIQLHQDIRPVAGKAPVTLVGSGTDTGPLAGFIRNNTVSTRCTCAGAGATLRPIFFTSRNSTPI